MTEAIIILVGFAICSILAYWLWPHKPVKVKQLATLEPGKTYIIQLEKRVSTATFGAMYKHLENVGNKYGVRFALFEPGMNFVTEEVVKDESI